MSGPSASFAILVLSAGSVLISLVYAVKKGIKKCNFGSCCSCVTIDNSPRRQDPNQQETLEATTQQLSKSINMIQQIKNSLSPRKTKTNIISVPTINIDDIESQGPKIEPIKSPREEGEENFKK